MSGEYRADTDRSVLALIREYGRPYLHLAGLGLLLRLIWLVPGRAGPVVLGYLVDGVFGEQPLSVPLVPATVIPETQLGQLWLAAGVIFGLAALGHLFQLARTLAWGAFAYNLQHDIRTATYDTVQRLEMGFFDDHQSGEVMSILNNDVNEMEGFFTGTIDEAMDVVSFVVGAAVFMLLLNWQFALVALAAAPLIVVANYYFAGRIERVYGEVRETVGLLNAQLRTSISGIGVVKAYTAEPHERERVRSTSRDVMDAQRQAVDVRAKHYPSMRVLTGLGVVLTFSLGGYWVTAGPPGPFTEPMTAGTLVTFLLYVRHIGWPMQQIASVVDGYKSAAASADRILGVQNAAERVTERADATDLKRVDGRVTYDGVTFGYPESDRDDAAEGPVVEGVSFEVEPGETVGIVGPTGAGKSTLLKLLVRFYDVDRGAVRVDESDVRDLTLDSLREAVGYISQEPFLFDGTVRENVTYGADVDDGTMWTALERAEADAFVEELPEGVDTTVGERGVKLSGGQRQRLCLARAMVHDPAILVLDEATSHVDNETEALIQRSVASVVADRTTLVVAHRLSTVRDADRIVVLDDGRVAERGTHDDLLDRDGLYADLWRVQVGEVQALPDEFVARIEARADALDTDD